MTYYQIENWLETPESIKIKNLKWVAMQNSFDGKIYKRLLKHPDPVRVFGIAILMAELASRAPVGYRGKLIGSDLSTGYTQEDMADKTGMPVTDFAFAIPILMSIGWVSYFDGSRKLSVIPDKIRLYDRTGQDTKGQVLPISPAPAAFFEKIIGLNYHGPQAVSMLSDFRSMPRLSNYNPGTEGIPEAMFYVLESIPAITKKYPAFKIYAFLQKAVNEKFSLMALAGAVKALVDLQHPPQDMAPYWQALIRNEKAQLKCWENEIWPTIKHDRYKLK
jgi:hypothetical protein